MTFVKKALIAMATLFSSKTASAVGASGAVVAAAAGLGLDWLPWAVGAAGSTVVYAYKPPTTRPRALANGVISVVLGGAGGPAAADAAASYLEAPYLGTFNAVLLLSFLLAVAWPWAAPVAFNGIVGMWNGFTAGIAARQQSKGEDKP